MTLINASASLIAFDSGWQIDLWGQNLTDEEYLIATFDSTFQRGDVNGYLGAPRTYGVTLRGEF